MSATEMFFFDKDAILQKYPSHNDAIHHIFITTHEEAVKAKSLTENHYYCAQSRSIRNNFSRPVYEKLGTLLFGDQTHTAGEMEHANARLGVNVESETNAGLVKVVSAVNICKRCAAMGGQDADCRHVTSRMRFTRSWDEPGTEILTCQRCGHVWQR